MMIQEQNELIFIILINNEINQPNRVVFNTYV